MAKCSLVYCVQSSRLSSEEVSSWRDAYRGGVCVCVVRRIKKRNGKLLGWIEKRMRIPRVSQSALCLSVVSSGVATWTSTQKKTVRNWQLQWRRNRWLSLSICPAGFFFPFFSLLFTYHNLIPLVNLIDILADDYTLMALKGFPIKWPETYRETAIEIVNTFEAALSCDSGVFVIYGEGWYRRRSSSWKISDTSQHRTGRHLAPRDPTDPSLLGPNDVRCKENNIFRSWGWRR